MYRLIFFLKGTGIGGNGLDDDDDDTVLEQEGIMQIVYEISNLTHFNEIGYVK